LFAKVIEKDEFIRMLRANKNARNALARTERLARSVVRGIKREIQHAAKIHNQPLRIREEVIRELDELGAPKWEEAMWQEDRGGTDPTPEIGEPVTENTLTRRRRSNTRRARI
jgi:hypothetical protein